MSLMTEERIAPYMCQQYEETCNLTIQNDLFHFPSFILFKYRVESNVPLLPPKEFILWICKMNNRQLLAFKTCYM